MRFRGLRLGARNNVGVATSFLRHRLIYNAGRGRDGSAVVLLGGTALCRKEGVMRGLLLKAAICCVVKEPVCYFNGDLVGLQLTARDSSLHFLAVGVRVISTVRTKKGLGHRVCRYALAHMRALVSGAVRAPSRLERDKGLGVLVYRRRPRCGGVVGQVLEHEVLSGRRIFLEVCIASNSSTRILNFRPRFVMALASRPSKAVADEYSVLS